MPPAISIGSIASTTPGSSRGPSPAPAAVLDVGVLVHRPADAVAAVVPRAAVAGGADHLVDRRADVAKVAAGAHRRDAGGKRLVGDVDQPLRVRRIGPTPIVNAASPCHPSTIAPQSMRQHVAVVRAIAGPGMPWINSSLTDAQITAGNPW